MKNKSLLALVAIPLTGLALAGSITYAQGQSSSNEPIEIELPITGDALKSASSAALLHTAGGKVTETEIGDEESYYEVEVTLENGNQVDVQLDENFKVVGEKVEGPGNENETNK